MGWDSTGGIAGRGCLAVRRKKKKEDERKGKYVDGACGEGLGGSKVDGSRRKEDLGWLELER